MKYIGKPLPNASRAQIPPAKLRDYALNPHHPDGSHKAHVFRAALGIGQADWSYLSDQLLDGLASSVVSKETSDRYGTRYEVSIEVTGRNGRVLPVTTAWFVPKETDVPRLVTAYIQGKKP